MLRGISYTFHADLSQPVDRTIIYAWLRYNPQLDAYLRESVRRLLANRYQRRCKANFKALPHRIKQRPCISQIRGIQTLSEPTIDGAKEIWHFFRIALLLPQST